MVCAYVDDGARSQAGFTTFLRHHASLLAVLPRWRVVYVGEMPQQTALAAGVFRRAFGATADLPPGLARDDIGEFFRLRRLYEREAWAELRTEGLDRFLTWRARVGADLDPTPHGWSRERRPWIARASPVPTVKASPLRGGRRAPSLPGDGGGGGPCLTT